MAARLSLFHGAAEVVSVTSDPETHFLSGPAMGAPEVLRGPGLSLLCSHVVIAILPDQEMEAWLATEPPDLTATIDRVDVTGMVILPGLVDGHTHPVWAGDRTHEFELKLAGASYMEVHAAGGGIHFTVAKTREATEKELLSSFLAMVRGGTTLLEAKSGYGLDLETERKMMRVIDEGARRLQDRITISGTFCGAHAIPVGKDPARACDDVLHQIEALEEEQREGKLGAIENIDVFCERGVFSVDQTKFILRRGMQAGLHANFHGEELSCLGSAEMGAANDVRAISHLEEVSDEGIEAMANAKTAAVLLPTTAYILKLKSPPARMMVSKGVPVALGSDFNPNAYCYSMPLVMNLGCVTFGLSLGEALVAATLNAAYSLGRGATHGALHVPSHLLRCRW